MENKILRKVFLGFIQLHILHHAKNEPFYGLWMIRELQSHGYEISAGTLYPILNALEKDGLLNKEAIVVSGKTRKYYSITSKGDEILQEGKLKCLELFQEIQ